MAGCMAIVNLGILAHVDAGKTTLTERILFETGVIRELGRVDKGTTQTDTLELERARGITIKSAVVSFQINDLKVNLIDTPGHADFIAEVERSMAVLDGVVLVISAVEGVQPQARRLARAIRSAGLPMMIFINKIDRAGARDDALLGDIPRKLGVRVVPMTAAMTLGDRSAEIVPRDRDDPAWRELATDLLAETSDRVISEFDRCGGDPDRAFIEAEIRRQVASGDIVPVYVGSAMTGVGVPELLSGVEEWLPTACEATNGPVAGSVFKIARRLSGEKIVYARLISGKLAVRDKIVTGRRN
jgi:ribosomal protection tetracycline resistance protein